MRPIYFCLLIILCGSFFATSYCFADNQSDLQTVRQSIIAQEKRLAEQKQQRIKLLSDLKKQETAIANLLASLAESDKALRTLSQDIAELNPQITELEKNQASQRKILARQLEGAFKLGKTTSIELIFAGQESERNERIITYYGYINQARQQRINDLKRIEDELAGKKALLQQKHQSQLTLQVKQQEQRDTLLANQQQRKQTISVLEQSMQLNQQKLSELKENEAALQAQIAKAKQKSQQIADEEAKQAAQIQARQQRYNYRPNKDERALMARTSGIGQPNHSLNWPVAGTILNRFGEPQQGELRWKGLVIKAAEGTKVRAIADGRVILASWLQGYGFIVALEHGRGDMTLYGYNQRVLVDVGDKITAGEEIALVGTTGGQGNAALYFEVRRDGKALDPSAWLKK